MRVEVLGGPERRRRVEEKPRLVAQTFEPGVSVCAVARRNSIAPGLLFTWRRQAREGRLGGSEPASPFVPVTIAPELTPSVPALAPAVAPLASEAAPDPPPRRRRTGLIEIELGGGRRLTVDRDVDAAARARRLGRA